MNYRIMHQGAFFWACLVFLLSYTQGEYTSICPPATYVGPNGCEWCTPAKYSDTDSGATSCLNCPTGSYSEFGATECFCKIGHTGPGNDNCHMCAAGTYKSSTGSAPCDECVLGKTSPVGSTGVGACAVLCQPGYGTSACTRCPAGTYKEVSGTSPCLACLGHKYVTGDSTQCLSCAVNFDAKVLTNAYENRNTQSSYNCVQFV